VRREAGGQLALRLVPPQSNLKRIQKKGGGKAPVNHARLDQESETMLLCGGSGTHIKLEQAVLHVCHHPCAIKDILP